VIVIVTGMHRSGTSAIAGTLHNSGISMGEEENFYPPPIRENPKGFFENKRFRNLNDAILRVFEYRAKSFNPDLPDYRLPLPDQFRGKMRDLITSYRQNNTNWGWKDPRTCLTLHYWLGVMRGMDIPKSEIKVVVSLRDEQAISASMKRRGNQERLGAGQFHKTASGYYSRLFYSLDEAMIPYHYVRFDNLMKHPHVEIRKLSRYLGVLLISKFVDPSISKGRIR
jgi:hypothetical protein